MKAVSTLLRIFYLFILRNDPLSPIKQAMKGLKNVTKRGKGPWFNSKYNIPESAKDFICNLAR